MRASPACFSHFAQRVTNVKRRQRVAADNPIVLGSLASDLNGAVKRLTEILGNALADHWDGRAGAQTVPTTKSLFDGAAS